MSFTTDNNTSPTTPSRPSFSRSTTMPAFRRALSIPSVDKSFATLRASSSKGLRRMSTFRKASTSSSVSTIRPSSSMDSVVIFTTPDYAQSSASCASPSEISPLTLTRPTFKRAVTMPAPVRALRSKALAKLPGFTKTVCESPPHKVSAASIDSVASVNSITSASTASTRRRSSSVSSVESFNTTEDRVTLGLRLRAFPSTILGVFTSIMSVLLILILPAMAADTPKRKPAKRPYERDITISDEQERNPPQLRRSTTTSRLSRRVTKTYRRTVRRVARARRAPTHTKALAVLFTPTPKRVRASPPVHVDPQNLTSEIPLFVYSSPIALPLAKGPAPTVRPAYRARKFALLPTLKEEEESTDAALCAGW
ncbi:hypothetical protein DFH09DRAFT_1074310 [Mycena vulgaris]|nr:hypothetical protein DFH09DRAFT_1074310 [Mycena vulgaris]